MFEEIAEKTTPRVRVNVTLPLRSDEMVAFEFWRTFLNPKRT